MKKIVLDGDVKPQVSLSDVVRYHREYACDICYRTKDLELFELKILADHCAFVLSNGNFFDISYKSDTIKQCIEKALEDGHKVLFFDDRMDYLKNR